MPSGYSTTGYYIDIQQRVTVSCTQEGEHSATATVSLYAGPKLDEAYRFFQMACDANLSKEDTEYVRLVISSGPNEWLVLSRRTSAGIGDW